MAWGDFHRDDWREVGPARRWQNIETGEEISRRQGLQRWRSSLMGETKVTLEKYRQLRAEKGIPSGMGRFQAIVRDYRKHEAERGRDIEQGQARLEVRQHIIPLLEGTEDMKRSGLVAIGRRSPQWAFMVGESPTDK